jgi:putative endonuclease
MIRLTEFIVRTLHKLSRGRRKAHIALGNCGEAEAYFYLRRLGYRIVATNFRAPHGRGEIDLIGWDNNVLCFIEVKTRTDDSFAPPSSAVTKDKQSHIREVARAYLQRLPGDSDPSCRFDVVSVVPSSDSRKPHITLRRGAFSWNSGRKRSREYRESSGRRFRRDTKNLPRFR